MQPQNGPITVRRARPGDALAIRKLLKDLGYSPDTRAADETVSQVVRHPEAAVFVAVEGLEVVGYVTLSHRPQIRLGGRLATVDEMVVASGRRGRGTGSLLLEAALSHARSLHCRRVEVTQSRVREAFQRRFYVERGFTEVDSAVLRIELPAV
jgi:GNAT superfamily N-acetyltransferase